jgi:hypothetical protein
MDHYLIWCNLRESHRDLEFVQNVNALLTYLKERGDVESFALTRRKLGFGPPELGEFMIDIRVKNMTGLEAMFQRLAARSGQIEELHRNVFSMVTDFRSALFRDFPDSVREGS